MSFAMAAAPAPGLSLTDMRSPEKQNGVNSSASSSGEQAARAFEQMQLSGGPAAAAAGASTAAASASSQPQRPAHFTSTPSLQYPSLHFNFNGAAATMGSDSFSSPMSAPPAVGQQQQQQQHPHPLLQSHPSPSQSHEFDSSVPLSAFHPQQDSLSGVGSPLRPVALVQPLDASFRSVTSASHSHSQQLAPQPLQSRSAAVMGEMLEKARQGLRQLQSEVETERQRRLAAERDLADAKRDLSNERMAGSSSAHSQQLQHDKESRLLRELAAQKLLEASLRTQASEEAEAAQREREERIRLSERLERVGGELRTAQESLRERESQLLALRKQHSSDQAQSALSLQENASELKRAREQLELKSSALKETEEVMRQIDAQLVQLDTQKAARESQRLLDEQKHATQIAQLHRDLDDRTVANVALQQSNEVYRAENARLVSLARDAAAQMARQWEAAYAESKQAIDDKMAAFSRRIEALNQQEHQLSRVVHDSAVQCASLKERLHSKSSELSAAAAQVAELKQQNILLASEHSHHMDALQDSYESRLRDLESSVRDRDGFADEGQRHAFEMAVQGLEREVERAIDAAMHAAEQQSLSPASHLYSPAASAPSPYSSASALDAASSSLSPMRETAGGGGSGAGHTHQQSFHVTALTLLKQQLLHRLDSTFHALHQSRARLAAEAHHIQSQLQHELASHSAVEADMSRRLAELGESHASEMRVVRGGGQQEQLLLEERASVIRELKRRYKREQSHAATLHTQLVQVRSQLQQVQEQHAADVHQWRELSRAELHSSVLNVESIAAKRLDAENRLRKRAEEEADSYVRACTQSERKIFQLQQEKAQLITFFKQQLQETRMQAASSSNSGGGGSSGRIRPVDADALLDAKLQLHLQQSSSAIAHAAAASFHAS